MTNFFQGFNFDTFLALISCITGIVALFLGGSAYKKCKINKNSFDDKKKYGDNCTDNSQKAGGNIINNNCDIQALTTLTRENFQASLNQAYSIFEQKTADNLHRIIEETNRIVQENKIDISSFTKIDWINIYFENAKTTSDEYMQNVWAKVLAKELEISGSFSFQTLNVLRNMSADDFKLFEIMCSLQVNYMLLTGNIYNKYNLEWLKRVRLKELGLLNLDSSEQTKIFHPLENNATVYCNQYAIVSHNTSDKDVEHKLSVHLLSSSAIELMNVVVVQVNEQFIIDYTREIIKNKPVNLNISLHKIMSQNGPRIEYFREDLLNQEGNSINTTAEV